jgi:hypothetical protein
MHELRLEIRHPAGSTTIKTCKVRIQPSCPIVFFETKCRVLDITLQEQQLPSDGRHGLGALNPGFSVMSAPRLPDALTGSTPKENKPWLKQMAAPAIHL